MMLALARYLRKPDARSVGHEPAPGSI